MNRRRWWLAGVGTLLLVLAAVMWLAGWLDSRDARAEAERVLSDAIGRPVHIAALEVDPLDGFVQLRGVRVDNLPDWGTEPLLTAERVALEVDLEELLDRRIDGAFVADDITLRVLKRGTHTNVEGIGRKPSSQHREPLDLRLDIEIGGATVELVDLDRDETLLLRDVSVGSTLSNRADARSTSLALRIARASLHGVDVHDLSLRAFADEAAVRLEGLDGRVGAAGRLHGEGTLTLGDSRWSFALSLADIALDEQVLPVAATVYPPLLSLNAEDGEPPRGSLHGNVELGGVGLHWEAVRPTLTGRGEIRISDLVLPESSLLMAVVLARGGESGPWTLDEAGARFVLAEGWVALERVTVGRRAVRSPVQGRVSLAGELDLVVDLLPLLRSLPGGAHASIARYTTSLPVRVRGTTAEPDIEPPTTKDIATGLLGGALKRAVGE